MPILAFGGSGYKAVQNRYAFLSAGNYLVKQVSSGERVSTPNICEQLGCACLFQFGTSRFELAGVAKISLLIDTGASGAIYTSKKFAHARL